MDDTQDNIDIENEKFRYTDLGWAADDLIILRFFRVAGHGADDLTGDDRLILVRIGLPLR